MRERTPSDAQLEELRRLGVVAQVRRQARGETPLYDPMRVVTALASVNLPLTRALTEESQTVLPGLSLTELAEVLSTRLGPGAPSLSTLRNWERSDRIAPVRISPSQRRFYDPEQVVAAIAPGGNEADGALVSLARAAELLRTLLGEQAPAYVTLRRWEKAGYIDSAGELPSGRRLYSLPRLAEQIRTGVPGTGATTPHTAERSIAPPETSAVFDWVRLEAVIAETVAKVVSASLAEVRTLTGTLAGLEETLLALQSAPPAAQMQADAEASQLHADVRRVLSAVEGFQKTVMIRQDGEIGALRERLREMEARAKAAQPTFVGRSGTTY